MLTPEHLKLDDDEDSRSPFEKRWTPKRPARDGSSKNLQQSSLGMGVIAEEDLENSVSSVSSIEPTPRGETGMHELGITFGGRASASLSQRPPKGDCEDDELNNTRKNHKKSHPRQPSADFDLPIDTDDSNKRAPRPYSYSIKKSAKAPLPVIHDLEADRGSEGLQVTDSEQSGSVSRSKSKSLSIASASDSQESRCSHLSIPTPR